MTFTDGIIIIISIFLLIRGSSRGFMRSLINPFSIIITSILSVIYYQITKNAIVSLLIGLLGPLLLGFILKGLLSSWITATNSDIKPNSLSQLGGALLTLAWGWVFIALTLILLTVSASYNFIVKPLQENFSARLNPHQAAAENADPSSDTKSLSEDPRFQKVMQDPDIQKEIAAHDIAHLMSNPKMMAFTQQVMTDPDTMKKVMDLYSSQANQQQN